MFLQSALFKVADLNACNLKLRVGSERWTILVLVTCQCCPWVMKYCRTSCALRCWEGWSYPTSRCQYVDVSVDRRIPRPSSSALDECCHLSLQRTLYFKGYPIKKREVLQQAAAFPLYSNYHINVHVPSRFWTCVLWWLQSGERLHVALDRLATTAGIISELS